MHIELHFKTHFIWEVGTFEECMEWAIRREKELSEEQRKECRFSSKDLTNAEEALKKYKETRKYNSSLL